MTLAAGSDNELANARRIRAAGRILWSDPFVIMIVAVEYHVGVSGEEIAPERIVGEIVAMLSGAEQGLMPVCENAGSTVLAKVVCEPPLFGRSLAAAADEAALSIQ